MNRGDAEDAEARRRLVRRAALYTLGFFSAGVAIALAGAALIAWMLTRAGQPFLRSWLIISAIVILPGLLAAIWKTYRGR
jgi:hypothetical protein